MSTVLVSHGINWQPGTVTRRVTGEPSGPVTFELPAFVNNIARASAGTVDEGAGSVTVPAHTRALTVVLSRALSTAA